MTAHHYACFLCKPTGSAEALEAYRRCSEWWTGAGVIHKAFEIGLATGSGVLMAVLTPIIALPGAFLFTSAATELVRQGVYGIAG